MTQVAPMKQWQFEQEETSSGWMFSVYNEDGTRITEPYITEESARLIAAAPELLEALQQTLNLLDYYTPNEGYPISEREAIRNAHALAAKAGGAA